ncbi:MAG: hypothetical protein KJ584_05165 [Candidatus Omnitrophica bacterium]|nr:hypothetical protein [Candidatus Omnitrophota bacterium]
MERTGLKKVFTNLDEKYVELSDDDDIIYITAKDCNAISIRGIRESAIGGKLSTYPHYIRIKIYGYNGVEILPEDTVQFSIAELKKSGLPTLFPDKWPHVVYYHYPYRTVSSKLKLKKGIVLTKNKRLEIRIIRNGESLKVAKFEIKIECDKWYNNEMLQEVVPNQKQNISEVLYK